MLMETSRWGGLVVFLAAVAAFGQLRAPPAAATEPPEELETSKPSEPMKPLEAPELPLMTTKTSACLGANEGR
jgi:hypothetical protein